MHEKVCLITGATDGIGKVAAHELARAGATVVLVGRNAAKCASVADTIRQTTGNAAVNYLVADLSSQQALRELAAAFQEGYSRLDVLLNNVGAVYTRRQESVDGIEMTWALNHLSYFLLTQLLLDQLRQSAPSRVVNVSSDAHRGAGLNLADPEAKRGYNGLRAYAQSKLANIVFTYELARRLEGTGVTANALHPGIVATRFAANNGFVGRLLRGAMDVVSISAEEGAKTSSYLASSPEVAGMSGQYFDKCRAVRSSPASYDEQTARQLWELSAAMTGSGARAGA